MPKLSYNIAAAPIVTPIELSHGVKSVQIRNLSYHYPLYLAGSGSELADTSGRWEVRPRTEMVLEMDPNLKKPKFVGAGGGGAIIIEVTPFSFYGVRGMLQGDLNPTCEYEDYFEYTAANDNQNVAYNIATAFITARGGHRVRSLQIECVTNGAIIGFDNGHALARGPPVVGKRLNPGDVLILDEVAYFASIDCMNLVIAANTNIIGTVVGD